MIPRKYLLSLALSVGVVMANPGAAQTAAPAAPPAPAPAPAATAAAAPPAAPAANGAPARGAAGTVQPWDRPADGPAIFTDNFESGAINDKAWTMHVKGQPTITVQQNNVAHGKYALQAHYPKGDSGDYAFMGLVVPEALRDHFYGRAYVSINGIPAGHCVLMLAGSTGFQLADFLEIGASKGKFQPSFQLNKPLPPERPRGEKTYNVGTLPVGHWFCLEWEFFDKPDRIVLWVDGKLTVNQAISYQIVKQPPGPTINTGLTGGFFEFNLGFRAWGGAVANDVDIYYDDVAISDKPIGQLTPVPDKPAATPAAATPAAATPATPDAATTPAAK